MLAQCLRVCFGRGDADPREPVQHQVPAITGREWLENRRRRDTGAPSPFGATPPDSPGLIFAQSLPTSDGSDPAPAGFSPSQLQPQLISTPLPLTRQGRATSAASSLGMGAPMADPALDLALITMRLAGGVPGGAARLMQGPLGMPGLSAAAELRPANFFSRTLLEIAGENATDDLLRSYGGPHSSHAFAPIGDDVFTLPTQLSPIGSPGHSTASRNGTHHSLPLVTTLSPYSQAGTSLPPTPTEPSTGTKHLNTCSTAGTRCSNRSFSSAPNTPGARTAAGRRPSRNWVMRMMVRRCESSRGGPRPDAQLLHEWGSAGAAGSSASATARRTASGSWGRRPHREPSRCSSIFGGGSLWDGEEAHPSDLHSPLLPRSREDSSRGGSSAGTTGASTPERRASTGTRVWAPLLFGQPAAVSPSDDGSQQSNGSHLEALGVLIIGSAGRRFGSGLVPGRMRSVPAGPPPMYTHAHAAAAAGTASLMPRFASPFAHAAPVAAPASPISVSRAGPTPASPAHAFLAQRALSQGGVAPRTNPPAHRASTQGGALSPLGGHLSPLGSSSLGRKEGHSFSGASPSVPRYPTRMSRVHATVQQPQLHGLPQGRPRPSDETSLLDM